jgi:hypothetical protein
MRAGLRDHAVTCIPSLETVLNVSAFALQYRERFGQRPVLSRLIRKTDCGPNVCRLAQSLGALRRDLVNNAATTRATNYSRAAKRTSPVKIASRV